MSTPARTADNTPVAAQRAAIQAEALRWLGTPYHHGADVLGAGVDCLMLLVRVYAAVGLIPPHTDPRPYAHQWHLHHSDELYLQGLERFARPLPAGAAPEVGDVALWRFGRAFSHAGLLVRLPGQAELQVLHALKDAREVTVQPLDSAHLAGRACRFFSLFDPESSASHQP